VRSTLSRFGHSEAEVQVVNGDTLNVRTAPLTEGGPKVDRMLETLAAQAGTTTAQISRQDVGPTWGAQISNKAIKGLIIFLVLVTVYIAFRFEWKMALAGQTALFHDLVITAGIYALVGRTVTPATVIAILTILGYSLYDTVVIFDKVKENSESMAVVARETYSGVVNMSLNQVFMRSVNTSLVVLLPILSLLLFGGDTLKDFAFALFVGVSSGAYSSIFVASPVLAVLKEREPKNVQIRTRALARAASRPAERERILQAVPGGSATVTGDGGGESAAVGTSSGGRRPSTQSATSARPKKKKRKTTAAQRRRR
jgi:preprotein translocase subunit SecF